MSEERDPVIDEIIALLADTNDPTKVTAHSRLLTDLGLDGEDASDFIEAFAERFDVDFSSFRWLRCFGDEGLDALAPTIAALRRAFSTKTRLRWRAAHEAEREISIIHLADVAKTKRWIEPGPEAARATPRPPVRALQPVLALLVPLPFIALCIAAVLVFVAAPDITSEAIAAVFVSLAALILWTPWRNVTRKLESSPT